MPKIKALVSVGVCFALVIPSCTQATSSVLTYSNLNTYQPPPQNYYLGNTSSSPRAVFQARDDISTSYAVPPVAGSDGGGGYSMMAGAGGYGAPAMQSPSIYKYEIHPVSFNKKYKR